MRTPMLQALAYAQLLIIAVKGRRSYDVNELDIIFNRGYLMLFGALEALRQMADDIRSREHEDNPDGAPAPKRFKRQRR